MLGRRMARKRKRTSDKASARNDAEKPKPVPKVATGLGSLLKGAGITAVTPAAGKPRARGPHTLPPPAPEPLMRVIKPSPAKSPDAPLSGGELRALNDAYAGVRKLGGKPRPMPYREVAPSTQHDERQVLARQDDAAARARLGELVGGGVRFKVTRDDDHVQGLREGVSPKHLARIEGRGFSPEATLDLHGERAADVATRVASFVRTARRKCAKHVIVITGKGLHSEGGVSVLRDAAVKALTAGGAAPVVAAFCTAHPDHGGSGALCVLLGD
jgi:DNA-nicking Smr family endonuclease